jgi:hypothetical protein
MFFINLKESNFCHVRDLFKLKLNTINLSNDCVHYVTWGFEGGLEMLFIQNLNLFCLKLFILVFLDYFNMVILKINFKK